MSDHHAAAAILTAAALIPALFCGVLFTAMMGSRSHTDTPHDIDTTTAETICGTSRLKVPQKISAAITEAAKTSGLPQGYLAAIANQESGFDPTNFTDDSNGGTWGLFQLNREEWHKVYPQGDNPGGTPAGITDPMTHAHYAGIYLKNRLAALKTWWDPHYPHSPFAALPLLDQLVIAHNAGEGNLIKYPHIPSITRSYLGNVHRWFTGAPCRTPAPAAGLSLQGRDSLEGRDEWSGWMRAHGFTPGDPREIADPNRFYFGECVSYAAFAIRAYTPHHDFTNYWRGQHFGNAIHWPQAARAAGLTVDTTPAVGSIVQSHMTRSGLGHVALVTRINPDGTFNVNEGNYTTQHTFGTRKNLRMGTHFNLVIHFERPTSRKANP